MANLAFAIPAIERDAALSAAEWLPGFYSRVGVVLSDDRIELFSESYDIDALAAIWSAALANELLLARGESRRSAAHTALTQ